MERVVYGARWAASLDSIETALSTGAFKDAVLATDDPALRTDTPGVIIDADPGPFHFGRRLAGVIRRHHLSLVFYLGGGSVPLLAAGEFEQIARALAGGSAVTNNIYSTDLAAFPIREPTVGVVEVVFRDNSLSKALAEGTAMAFESLPRTPATQMDIDGPTDIAVLALSGLGGRRLQAYLQTVTLDLARYRRLLPLFTDTSAQIVVAGRVGSHAWQYLERETACRVRLFAEERGMEAEGRAETGEARALLGFFLHEVGPKRFFAAMTELGDAALVDTRVLLAHEGIAASREDRFLSDTGRWREISEPWLREFTHAATEAPIPVLLGGHSLMSGGLMLLNEHAWSEKDAGLI